MQAQIALTLHAPISMLEKTPAILDTLLRDLSADLLQWKPAPERWSIVEVLAHLVVIEQLYETRVRRIINEDSPTLTKYVAPHESEVRKKSTEEYLEEFIALRRAFVFFLHAVPSAVGSRTAEHPVLGMINLSEMLHELANHDLGHLRQIAELYRAYAFYPYAGPFQRYSRPQP
jgi:DinB superfamily